MTTELPDQVRSGALGWSCPSNIALIKYWGKKPGQFPMNPSLSMTLQEARTRMKIRYTYEPGKIRRSLRFRFEGKEAPAFEQRIDSYLEGLVSELPLLSHTHLEIDSENSFPHSSGIASSASAFGALALCLVQVEEEIRGPMEPVRFWQQASKLARLGSGSASRSVYPGFALWGKQESWEGSSDEFAIPYGDFHVSFQDLRDAILLVESGAKPVSSSAGHSLMETNPFAGVRFAQARENLDRLRVVMGEGDWQGFIGIMEEEALSLHAMMMTGRPGYLLMQPGTLSILQAIRAFRKETRCRLGFTLDAGANVHLLYAGEDAPRVEAFISSELLSHCEDGRLIHDRMGEGPQKLEL
jgi:diphosphomevalonate decarboxylase